MAAFYSDRLLRGAPVDELSRCDTDATRADSYIPYAIDWRFLPEPALMVKDAARHALAVASNAAAVAPPTRGVWAGTLGRRTLNAVTRAGRIFIHIPKTGGTSVCARLYGRNLPHYTRSFYTAAYGSRIAALPSFSIVRDPVDRLHSAYRFIRAGGTELMATSRFEHARLPAFASFADFVGYLAKRPATIDRVLVLRRQTDFVLDGAGQLQVDRIFVIGASGEQPAGLADYLGIAQLPRLNRSPPSREPVGNALRTEIEFLYAADVRLIEQVRRLNDATPVAAVA